MKGYTQGRALYGVLTKNTSTANLTTGDELANDLYRDICSMKDWPFLERNRTITTTASVQFTTLPYDCDQVREISVIPNGSTTRYTPRLVPSREFWDQLNLTSFTSDIPSWYFVFNGQIGLWPTPASANTIYVTQKTRVIDLSVADYPTGNILTATNGDKTIVGDATPVVWNASMTGRWMRITHSDAANKGDGLWYEISSVTNSTNLELVRKYGGASISAGAAAYTISQIPLLPESFQDMPWVGAAAVYWAKEEDARADAFQSKYDTKLKRLIDVWSSPTTDMVIDDGRSKEILNPNLTISL